jgi:curved DNA-binding protein CbpA
MVHPILFALFTQFFSSLPTWPSSFFSPRHPDKNIGNEEASTRYVEINEAYDTLSDAEKKRKYDLGDDPFANAAFRWGQGDSTRLFSETIDITSANWGHYIDRADPGEIWLVLFYRGTCNH